MRVFVAMSGGVDSSVAAALLVEQGHDVTGVTMQLLPPGEAEGQCCGGDAVRSARRVCDLLSIPHYVMNFRDLFEREVIAPFAAAYAQGRTPNPCIECNDRVKFSELLSRCMIQGAEALATGHYARMTNGADGQRLLSRGLDDGKDQSYFLYRLTHPAMDHVLFPVGEMRKSAVRRRALELGLPSAVRPDSQEVCFVPDGAHSALVGIRHPGSLAPGPILDATGKNVGTHRGLACYTVGQRKGLGIAAPQPLYVTAVDAARNALVVGPADALRVAQITADHVVWHGTRSERVQVQTRYRMAPVPGTARLDRGLLTIELDTACGGVAPGQAVVCYAGDTVIGGGVVTCAS